jgi:hypothetical protein
MKKQSAGDGIDDARALRQSSRIRRQRRVVGQLAEIQRASTGAPLRIGAIGRSAA